MARSQFVWLLIFDDGSTKYVKAQTISQMAYCNEIDLDTVINIIRIELISTLSDYPNAIEIKFED